MCVGADVRVRVRVHVRVRVRVRVRACLCVYVRGHERVYAKGRVHLTHPHPRILHMHPQQER